MRTIEGGGSGKEGDGDGVLLIVVPAAEIGIKEWYEY